ncbi:MAG: hypothetical protein FWC21_06645 [Treponema sp.]|nr:hypothetical protein [Treponema sp.]
MKKLVLFVLLFFMVSCLCFSIDIQFFGGIPLTWEEGDLLGNNITTQMTSFSLGFGTLVPINDRVSLYVFDELILPQTIKTTTSDITISIDKNSYEMLVGMSIFFGPVFNVFTSSQGKIKIPITTGIRWTWLVASTKYVVLFGNNFGLGAGLGIEYHTNNNIYFFGRAMIYYDFYSYSMTTTSYGSSFNFGFIGSFGVTPNIGIGISI